MAERTTAALYGLYIPDRDDKGNKKGSQILLKPPESLDLIKPRHASEEVTFDFESSNEASEFSQSIMERGWEASVKFQYKMVNAKGSIDERKKSTTEDAKIDNTFKSESKTKCLYVPMMSFQISKGSMCLTESALEAAHKITDFSSALEFLEVYGSHVSTSWYDLGGIYLEEFAKVSNDRKSHNTSKDVASFKASGNAGANISGNAGANISGISGGFSSSNTSIGTSSENSNVNFSRKHVWALGPTNVKNEAEFREKLNDCTSWNIISKEADKENDLVAVWELLNPEDVCLRKAATLLCQAWLNCARCSAEPILLIDQAERFYRKWVDNGKAEMVPLPHELQWKSPAQELAQKLQQIVELHPSTKRSDEIRDLVTSCMDHLKNTTDECLQERITDILHFRHGFDIADLADNHVIRSIIEDLNKINLPTEKKAAYHLSWDDSELCFNAEKHFLASSSFRYIGDIVVDKPYTRDIPVGLQNHDAARQTILIDCLRHSLDPFQKPTAQARRQKTKWNPDSKHIGCPFQDLVDVMQKSELPVQIEVCRYLLLQRAALPLVVSSSADATENLFTHYVQALAFVQIKLLNEEQCYVAEDVSLPRLAFLADVHTQKSHTAKLASRIFSCNFPSQYMIRVGTQQKQRSIMEVGIGFVKLEETSIPWLVLHVEGPYQKFISFLKDFVDVIVLEVDEFESKCFETEKQVIQWKMDVDDGSDLSRMSIWGTESHVVEGIQQLLVDIVGEKKHKASLAELCTKHFHPQKLICFREMIDILDKCNFEKIKESLVLHGSFVTEAHDFFQSLKLNGNPAEKYMKDKACKNEQTKRYRCAPQVAQHPLMQLFHRALSQQNGTIRRISLIWLEQEINQKLLPIFESSMSKSRKRKGLARQSVYAEKGVGLVHLWRELCHIFEASPDTQRLLAKLAAQHLLDGFHLEILDGDATMFCRHWVETVMSELDVLMKRHLQKTARLFVLSVMGLQSSGKSTHINLMFGVQLRASAGRCTRGVIMQLVPSKRKEYDYVLILDTEGLRSSETFGTDYGEVRDNRLATFGLLPADASIFMVSNEDDSGLKEVLPMVLLGFKGSVIAEESGGKIRTKMFFVYRSVDTNDKQKLSANKEKLQMHLEEAARDVSNMGRSFTPTSTHDDQHLQNMFQALQVNEDENESDVRCMGNLKKGNKPPEDIPNWEYGSQVMELREYINSRVLEMEWNPVDVKTWTENLIRVWDCICKADFELSFRSAIEFSSYAKLQETLSNGPRKMVGKKYLEVFESLERRLRQLKSESDMQQENPNINHVSDLCTELKDKVKSVIENERQRVTEILAAKAYSKWSSQETIKWENFCVDMESFYCRRVQDMRDGVLEFDAAARNYEIRIRAEIVSLFTCSTSLSGTERNDQFVSLFNRILMEAGKSHPPLAKEVNKRVHEAYTRMDVAKEVNLAGYAKDSIQERLRKDLDNAISGCLKHVKQYSEVDVEQVIAKTKEILNNPAISREMRQTGHRYVKDKTSAMMVKIQEAWDQEHNICEKLKQAKGRLRNFFDGCANHIGTGKILISELKHLLMDQIEVRHHDVVVRRVSDVLQTQPWVLDWKKLRACLDLHLLVLLDKEDERMFEFVGDVPKHYSEVSTLLVGKEIQKIYKEERQKYIHNICQGLSRVALSFRRTEGVSVKKFLESLTKILCKDLAYYEEKSSSLQLGSFIVSHIGDKAYEGGSAKLDSEFFDKDMNQVCEELMNESNCDPPATMSKTLKLLVNEAMKRLDDSYVRPRCSAKCPTCGHLCYLEANHGSVKHNTVHQISGLSGVFDEKTGELWKWSCSDDVQKENRFKHEDWHNANEFANVFNDWRNPTSTLTDDAARSLELREHIFYHYQKDLARLHKRRPCKDIPDHYNRDLGKIRSSLKNELEDARYNVLHRIFVEEIEENRARIKEAKKSGLFNASTNQIVEDPEEESDYERVGCFPLRNAVAALYYGDIRSGQT